MHACINESPIGSQAPEGRAHEDAVGDSEGEADSIVARVAPVADGVLAQQHAVLPQQALRMLARKAQLLRARLRLTQPAYQLLVVPACRDR